MQLEVSESVGGASGDCLSLCHTSIHHTLMSICNMVFHDQKWRGVGEERGKRWKREGSRDIYITRALRSIKLLPVTHFWWTHGCQLLSQFTNLNVFLTRNGLETHVTPFTLISEAIDNIYDCRPFLFLHFLPIHPHFYPSKTGFTRPNDALNWHTHTHTHMYVYIYIYMYIYICIYIYICVCVCVCVCVCI